MTLFIMKVNSDTEIEEFISSLEAYTIAKALRTIDLLEEFGSSLGMPHSKKVAAHIFELRIRGKQEVRLFYCFHKSEIRLLNGFVKKSEKTPKRELQKATNKYNILVA